jgi:hypothetical protein
MRPITAAVCLLAVVAVVAVGRTGHDQPAIPTPGPASATTVPTRPTSSPPVVIDGTVENDGTDPFTADCAGERAVHVHPDTSVHRAEAAHLCQVSDQDWQTLESVAKQGGGQ